MKKVFVSVIITTKNSAQTLKSLLDSIKKQSYAYIEIILIDNNSSDETVDLAKLYTNLVFQEGPERSAQRNFGSLKASGKYLLFLDSDMVLTENVIEECVSLYDKNSFGGVVIPEKSFGQGIWAEAKILERDINAGESYFEAARFFPRKIFKAFKGYDETLTGPEDWDLPQRIVKKYTIGRIESMILHNEGNLSLKYLAKKKFYYGLSSYKYLKKHGISIISPTTIYLLRPAFYKNWYTLFSDPFVTLAMIFMLIIESISGGLGYIVGRLKND